jgi:hypothetical protein
MLQYLRLRKFATVSSSELETIILFGPLSYKLSPLLLFLGSNELTGNLDPIFCNNDAFLGYDLVADCAGSPPEVVCSCCVDCY